MTSDEHSRSAATATELLPGYDVRPLAGGDAAALAEAYTRNREHLALWEPSRRPEFFTEPAQRADAEGKLAAVGRQDPWVIWHADEVVGR